jgi:hypothetical protein
VISPPLVLLGLGAVALLGAMNARRTPRTSWLALVGWPAALLVIELAPLLIGVGLVVAASLVALGGIAGAAGWTGLGAIPFT